MVHSYQYELFCGFMAMVAESPSVTDFLKTLVASLQKLIDSGWHISKNADKGIGCGHTQCWNSELGRFIELRKAIEKVKKS